MKKTLITLVFMSLLASVPASAGLLDNKSAEIISSRIKSTLNADPFCAKDDCVIKD